MRPASIHSFIIILLCPTVAITVPLRGNCGSPAVKPNLSRIVGGRDAVPYSWPWHAAIYRRNILLGPTYLCGASLLNDQWLLSAGHCFFGLMKLHSYDVQLGAFRHADKEGEMIAVEKVYFHPKYNPLTLERDAALLKLKRKVKMSDKISPVCLPRSADEQPKNNSIAYVTGWGRTGESWTASHTLKQVDVVVYSADRCRQFYDHYVNTDVMICAGADEGGKDSCQGDSGGPLVSYDGSRKQWIQHGIVSWGFGCAEPDQPGVYSKVSSFVDWINGTVYGGKRSPTAGLVIDLSAIDGQQNSTDIQSSRIRQQEYEDAIAEQFWTPAGFDPAMMRQRLVEKNNNTEVR